MRRPRETAVAPRHAHDHAVQFYADDRDLADTVSRYLVDALDAEQPTIVVATPAHRAAFEARLVADGVDVAAAVARRQVVMLDAEETMGLFLVDGRPDAARFRKTLTELIGAVARPGTVASIYGEMVAVLWESGLVNAALELEMLWNELAEELEFSLFCAYSSRSIIGDDAFDDICRLHSALVGPTPARREARHATPPEASRSFAPTPDSPRAARRFVAETLLAWEKAHLVGDASLVVTELATNAVLHARSVFTVTVSARSSSVRICVRDAGGGAPAARSASIQASTGRGLGLIAALAGQWHVEALPVGKQIWAELGA